MMFNNNVNVNINILSMNDDEVNAVAYIIGDTSQIKKNKNATKLTKWII